MARTKLSGGQLKDSSVSSEIIADNSVRRLDLNVTETGQAVLAKIIEGAGIALNSTGVDSGTGDVTVSLRAATASTLGGIKVGAGLSIDGNGVLSATAEADTLATVTARGATTTSAIYTGPVTVNNRTVLAPGGVYDNSTNGNNTGIAFGGNTIYSTDGSGVITVKNLGDATYRWGDVYAQIADFYGVVAGYFLYDTTPAVTIPTVQGTTYWDSAEETVALIMNGAIQHIGLDTFYNAKNSTGSTIPKGTAVGFAGTNGASGHLLISPFLANGSQPSTYYMGITAEDIPNGDFGKVMQFGKLKGVNTSAFANGNILYASTTVAGGFQTTVPQAPNNIIVVAAVVSAGSNGTLMIRATLGSNINNDEGVKITSPTTNQLLQLQANGLWENKTIAAILGGTSSQFVKGDGSLDSNVYLTGNQTITLSGDVSGSGTTAITTTIGAGKVTNAMLAGSIAASKLIGTDITTVGTIGTGVWNGTAIADAYIASASTWNAKIGGSGTTGRLAKFTSSGTVGDSVLKEDGGNIYINNGDKYIILDADSTGTGSLALQAGRGSAAFGGSVIMYSNAHATKAGYTEISTSAVAGAKIRFTNTAFGAGSELMSLSHTELITFGATDTGEAHIFGGSARVNGALTVSTGRTGLFSGDNFSLGLAQTVGQANYFYLGTNSSGDLLMSDTNGVAKLTITQAGAATFSSSVTVGGLLELNLANSGTNAYHTLNRNAITTENMFKWVTNGVNKWWLGQRSKNSEDGFSLYSGNIGSDALYFNPSGGASFANNVYAQDYYANGGWFRNSSSGTGLYNTTNNAHFYSRAGGTWGVSSGASSIGGLTFWRDHETTLEGQVYFDTSGFGLLNRSGAWAVRSDRSNAHVRLYYNGVEKLRTEDWGARVSGYLWSNYYQFVQDAYNPATAPRTATDSMSIKMWDNYFYGTGLGYDYGTMMQYYSRGGHVDTQVYFDAGGETWYRSAAYSAGWQSWKRYITDGNITSFAPTLTGTGASGTWNINISGNAATATSADQIDGQPFRNTTANSMTNPDTIESNGISYTGVSLLGQSDGALYSQAYSSGWQHQIFGDYRTGQIAVRGKNSGTWQAWRTILDSSNFTSYAPSLTGAGATGTWNINIEGFSKSMLASDIRTLSPASMTSMRMNFGFTSWNNNNTSSWADFIHLRSYGDNSGGNDNLVMFRKDAIGMRIWQQSYGSTTPYSSYADVWTSNDFTSTNVSNWNTAFGWGNHASIGYLTAETDTLATVTARGSSTNGSIFINGIFTGGLGAVTTSGTLDWNDVSNARAGQGYTLLLGTATNGMGGGQYYHPVSFEYSSKNGSGNMTQLAIPYTGNGIWYRNRYGGSWSSWARVWDDSSFTSTNITNWNTAYGWGNHASAGYALASSLLNYLPLAGGTLTGAVALNDNKLYLRTNGDNNHYLWNATDDWEELVAYTGTGFRVSSSTGETLLAVYGASVGAYTYSPYSFRAPIFYDSTDTGYYLDPNGNSNLQYIQLNAVESMGLYGIRGRFTNEHIHLYNKVGIGDPRGWGVGQADTPNQGLSTYGGINIAYGDNSSATINAYTIIKKDWGTGNYNTEAFTIRGTYASLTLRNTYADYKWLLHTDAIGDFHFYGGSGVDTNVWTNRFSFRTNNDFAVNLGNITVAQNVYTSGVRIGRDFSITNRATVRLDANGDAPADILFGRTPAANESGWSGVYWALSSRNSSESNEFRLYRGNANTGGSELVVMAADTNGGVTFVNNVYSQDYYAGNWFRNYSNNTGLYNQTNATHFYSKPTGWAMSAGGNTYGSISFYRNHESSLEGYVYFDSAGFGLLNAVGNWAVRSDRNSTHVRLYYNGQERLRTEGGGLSILGNASTTGYVSAGGTKLSIGILDLNSGGSPAQIRINTKIPFNSGSADFTVNIKGFKYGTSNTVSLSLSWHYYLDQFWNRNAISNGSWAPTITLARDANGFVVIHLSSPGYWPKLYVESMYSSAYGDAYSADWTFTDADLSDCTHAQTVPYKALSTDISGSAGSLSSMNISQFTNDSNYATTTSLASYLLLSGGTMTGNIGLGGNYNVVVNGGANSWGGYPGVVYTGGNGQFRFHGTAGVLDVYADGNFYATDSNHLVLHTGNYNSYAPTLGGIGATGTWGINVTGYATQLNGYAQQTVYTILDGPSNGPVIKVRYDGATADRWIDIGFKDGYGVYSEGLKIHNGDSLTFRGYTVWHAASDGAGTGLDADLLDGQHGSYYQPAATAITTANIGSQSVSYAQNSTRLYATGSPYEWGQGSPYYMRMMYDGNRWRLAAVPATPADIGVHYADYAPNAGDASTLGGRSSGQFQVVYNTTLDLSALDSSLYYPVTIPLPTARVTRMRIKNALNSNVPSWASHAAGFSIRVDWSSNANGWGTIPVQKTIHNYTESFSYVQICGGLAQLTNSSQEVIWLRGGGIYYFEADQDLSPAIQTSSYTIYGQTVDVVSSPVNNLYSQANGYIGASISGNAETVTNGVYTTGAYSNPAWITSLAWSKISGAPSFLTAETDTLATVTGRGATTSSSITVLNTVYARKAQADGDYTTAALWTESYDNTTTGVAFHISGILGKFLEMRTNGVLYWGGEDIWHTGNDGAGSGLDADMIDGIQASRIVYGDGDKKSSSMYSSMNTGNQTSGFFFYENPTGGPFGDWTNWINVMGNSWTNNYGYQLAHAFHSDSFAIRRVTNGTFASWRTIIDSGNYTSYSPSLTGTGASGTWGINISGNAATASNLVNGGGVLAGSGSRYIVIDSTDGWSFLRLNKNTACVWDIAQFNGGNLEFRPAGGATNSFTMSSAGVFTAPSVITSSITASTNLDLSVTGFLNQLRLSVSAGSSLKFISDSVEVVLNTYLGVTTLGPSVQASTTRLGSSSSRWGYVFGTLLNGTNIIAETDAYSYGNFIANSNQNANGKGFEIRRNSSSGATINSKTWTLFSDVSVYGDLSLSATDSFGNNSGSYLYINSTGGTSEIQIGLGSTSNVKFYRIESVASTTTVTNLNADFLDGYHASAFHLKSASGIYLGDGSSSSVAITLDGLSGIWDIIADDTSGFTVTAQGFSSNIVATGNTVKLYGATNTSTLETNTTTTYGTWLVTGTRGSYSGFSFGGTNKPHLMFDNSNQGGGIYYQTGNRWVFYHDYGNNRTAIGSSATTAGYILQVNGNTRLTNDLLVVGSIDTGGSFAANIRANLSGNQTLAATDYTLENTGGAATYTLPAASTCTRRIYCIINHGTGAITTSIAYRTANGSTTTTIAAGSRVMIQSDGSEWLLIAN